MAAAKEHELYYLINSSRQDEFLIALFNLITGNGE
jgi:hypothetical protein